MDTLNDTLFDKIFKASDYDYLTLSAGFTVIVKDLAEYICNNAYSYKGTESFQSVYTSAISEDRFFLNKCSPLMFISLREAGFYKEEDSEEEDSAIEEDSEKEESSEKDTRLKKSISSDPRAFKIEYLNKEALKNHQWLIYPGWILTKAFQKKFITQLCDSDVPFQKYEDREISKEDLAKAITIYLLDNEFTKDLFWYPFIIYLSILIIETSKHPYCNGGE